MKSICASAISSLLLTVLASGGSGCGAQFRSLTPGELALAGVIVNSPTESRIGEEPLAQVQPDDPLADHPVTDHPVTDHPVTDDLSAPALGESIGSNLKDHSDFGLMNTQWAVVPENHQSGPALFAIDAPHGAEVLYSFDRDDLRSAGLSFTLEDVGPGRHTILVEVRDPNTGESHVLSHTWIQAPKEKKSKNN